MKGIRKQKVPVVKIEQPEELPISNVELLKQIAENTEKTNTLLSQALSERSGKKGEGLSIDKPLQFVNKRFQTRKTKIKLEEVLLTISDNIQKVVDYFIGEVQSEDITSLTKVTKKTRKKRDDQIGGDSLKNIETYTHKILSTLQEKESPKRKKSEKKKAEVKITVKGLDQATKDFSSLGVNIDKKTVRAFKSLQRQIEQMAKPKFVKNLKGLNAVMHEFAGKISELSKHVAGAVISMKELIRVIGLTATALLMPALEKGLKRFTNMFESVNTKLGEARSKPKGGARFTWKEMLMGLAIGITAVVGSLIIIKYVDWKDVFKLLGFIAGLFTILSLFNLSRRGIPGRPAKTISRSVTKIKGDNMLTAFAFGLAVVVIGIAAIREIDWKGPLIMVGFITALYTVMIIGNKLMGGVGPGKGMFGFALGLGIIVLAIEAMDELFKKSYQVNIPGIGMVLTGTIGTIGILTFIFALGLAARIAGGGGFKGMLGLALGIGILVLSAEAAGEVFISAKKYNVLGVNWIGTVGTIGLIIFTYAMAGAIRVATGGRQALRGGAVLAFVGSIMLILWAVKSTTKLVAKYGSETVLLASVILAGFTAVMSKILIHVNNSMKGIRWKDFLKRIAIMTGAILIISVSMGLLMYGLSKINMKWDSLWQFGILTFLMVGIFIGIHQYIRHAKLTPSEVKKTRNVILQIALSFLAMSVPMFVLSYVDVSWKTFIQYSVLVVGSVAIFIGIHQYIRHAKLTPKKVEETRNVLLNVAGSFIAFAIPMMMLNNVTVSWDTILQMGVAILFIGGIAWFVGEESRSSLIRKGTLTLLLVSATFVIIATSMRILNGVDVSWKTLGQMGVTLLGLGLIAAALGVPVVGGLVLAGNLVLMALGASMVIVAFAMKKVSEANVSKEKVKVFAQSLKTLVQHIALITPAAIVATIAVVPLLAVATTTILIAKSLEKIASLDINSGKIKTFNESMKSLVNGFKNIGIKTAVEAGIKAKKLRSVADTSGKLAESLKSIQEADLNTTKVDEFNQSIKDITKTFKELDLKGLDEKTKLLEPVVKSAKDYALAIKEVSKIEIDSDKNTVFFKSIGEFVKTFDTTVQDTIGTMDKMEPGLNALSKIVSLPKQLADGISAIANMNYIEYENVKGQLVEKNRRKLKDDEITESMNSFGLMIGMLMEPIHKIGRAKHGDVINIGKSKIKIATESDVKRANEFFKNLGENYQPFFDATSTLLGKAEIMSDNTKTQNIIDNFGDLIGGMVTSSKRLKDYAILDEAVLKSLKNFNTFTESIRINPTFDKDLSKSNKQTYNFFDNVVKITERITDSKFDPKSAKLDVLNSFMDRLNDTKWNVIDSGLAKVNKNIENIVKNINNLQLEKVIRLNDTLKYLSENKTSDNIAEAVEKIDELIGTIHTYQEQEQNYKTAKIRSEQESRVLQEQISKNTGKSIDTATLQMLLTKLVNDLTGLSVSASIEGEPIEVEIVQNKTGKSVNKYDG